ARGWPGSGARRGLRPPPVWWSSPEKAAGCSAIAQLPWSRPEAMTKGLRRTPLYGCPGNCRMATDDDRRRRGLPISNVVLATARMAPHKGYRRGSAVVPIHGPVLQDRVPPRMARPEGFEPPTLWSEATCSGPLSYGRAARILAGRPRFTGPLSRPHARPAAVPRSSLNRKPSLWSPPGAAATVAGLAH